MRWRHIRAAAPLFIVAAALLCCPTGGSLADGDADQLLNGATTEAPLGVELKLDVISGQAVGYCGSGRYGRIIR